MSYRLLAHHRLKAVMLILLTFSLLVLPKLAVAGTAQPMLTWAKEVYTLDATMKTLQTADGSTVYTSGQALIKYDSSANKLWQKEFIENSKYPLSLQDFYLTKSGQAVVFATETAEKHPKSYILAVNQDGKRNWIKLLDTADDLYINFSKLTPTDDGGFFLVGTTEEAKDVYLGKFDRNGKKEWINQLKPDTKSLQAHQTLMINGIITTADGGCAIIGNHLTEWRKPDGPGWIIGYDADGFLLKTNKLGHLQWDTKLASIPHSGADFVLQNNDGNFILGGYIQIDNETRQTFVAKVDSSGVLKWKKKLPINNERFVDLIKQTKDQNYLLLTGPHITKLDQDGNLVWDRITYGINESIMETPDGYQVAGMYGHPPGLFYFTTFKLSGETNYILPADYNTLSNEEKVGYLVSSYELHIANLEQQIAAIKESGMTANDKARINQELANFEKSSQVLYTDIENNLKGTYIFLLYYDLPSKYAQTKLRYQFLAETLVDKHISITDELQKRYGKMTKVAGANMDGIIVTKAGNSYYNLDLSKVQKYTISANRIDILTKGKIYILYLNDVTKFPTYVGLGVQKDNIKYIFNTSKFKKPVPNDWILINDVVKFMIDQPKKSSLKYKDLYITKGKGGAYTIKISRVYTGPYDNLIYSGGLWETTSSYYEIRTKGPAEVRYFIKSGDCIAGGYLAQSNALLKFKNFSYKILLLK